MIWGFGRAAFHSTRIFVRFYYDPKVVYTGHIATLGSDYTSFGVTAGATFYDCTVYGPGLAALGQAYRPKVRSWFQWRASFAVAYLLHSGMPLAQRGASCAVACL